MHPQSTTGAGKVAQLPSLPPSSSSWPPSSSFPLNDGQARASRASHPRPTLAALGLNLEGGEKAIDGEAGATPRRFLSSGKLLEAARLCPR